MVETGEQLPGYEKTEQVEAVFDRGEARLRHWNRVAGCADLLYLGQQQVLFWINQSGNGFGAPAPHEIDDVPTGQLSDILNDLCRTGLLLHGFLIVAVV